jgi:hypothetical protein
MVRLAPRASERAHALRMRGHVLRRWLVPRTGDAGAATPPRPEDRATRSVEPASAPGGAPADGPAGGPPVLIAGRDSARRAMLLKELAEIMPGSTVFEEAGAFSEVLEHAPGSRMVVFSGDLPDVAAESFTRVLARRYPRLPVVRFDPPPPGGDFAHV